MKKIFILCIITTCILLTGCDYKVEQLSYNCNGEINTIEIAQGNSFKCKILSTDYKFEIKAVTGDSVMIEASDFGLSKEDENGSISLLDKEKEFSIEKGKKTKLVSQSMDYNESITFEW